MSFFRWVSILTLGLVAWLPGRVSAVEPVQFNRDIRPFLSDTCFHCHGPDKKTREADLRLDEEGPAKADLGGYAAIVPGDPEASETMRRILTDDVDDQMPPPDSGHSLTSAQKALFKRWIEEGAVYQKHWAFEPIVKRAVKGTGADDSAVSNRRSMGGVVDDWIQHRLEKEGLGLSEWASPETQLRRVTLDLTGLPPSVEETEAFLSEANARGLERAYEAVVDRLFKSPRYGERMAWQWMEAARYADTDGYQNDGPREMWRWRDWVIAAYNDNMPFDQFTIEQLAGDLLPDPTHEQLIATAFNRNARYNSEEGIPIDEFLLENAVDRVDTTATVWMGLTVGCARCHDHKFDPISQAEYYQLIDYFNDVAESGRAVKVGNSEPWIKTPTEDQRVRLAALEAKVEAARLALAKAEPDLAKAQSEWEKGVRPDLRAVTHGLDHHFTFDAEDKRVVAKQGGPVLREGKFGDAATVGGSGQFEIGKVPGLIGNGRFSVAFWMKPEDVTKGPVLSNEAANTGRNGILVEFIDGHLRWNINTRWISGVSTIDTVRTFKPGEWVHVALTNDGTQRAAGMTLYVNGEPQEVTVIRNTNSNAAKRGDGAPMSIGYSKHVGFWKGQIDELRFYTSRTLSPEEVGMLSLPASVADVAALPRDRRTQAQRKLIRLAFLESEASGDHGQLLASWQKAEEARTSYEDSLPTTMIMADLPEGRPSFVRERGVYDQLGQSVSMGVPEVLPPLPKNARNDRLGFAQWLVSPDHPLTARVTVNRYWQMLFGRGLVKTTEDFGSQGELPSHPELLDWLAADLMERGWDIQALLKTLVMSRTYRQSSVVTAEHLSKDPDNLLLARAPRLSLHGNVLRDQALAVSGLLVEKLGGPSVYPYQPAKLWEEASNAKYTVGKGEDLYRRSLYTYWKRTLAPPNMAVLDTADREYCAVRPKFTNTPLQALTLLNDVTFVEAARKLGERMLKEGGTSDVDRVRFGFRTVATRAPTPRELRVLTQALNDYRAEFQSQPKAAPATLKVGAAAASSEFAPVELAAATALANVLLNLEEVTTRE